MTRCQCKVYDLKEDKYRSCKNSKKFTTYINDSINYCQIHANVYIQHYAIIIQKYYKSYRTRHKIFSLFINLPEDLQRKVLYYIREPLYLARVYKKIGAIINPKIDLFLENIDHEAIFFDKEASLYHYFTPEQINNLYYLLKLIIKYKSILSKNILKEVYHVTNTLHITYILCDVEHTVYKNEWSHLIRYFNQLKTLKYKW